MSTNKSIYGQTNRSIARSAGVIGVATLCSRILGFVRDVVIARMFGVYLYAQAFVIAFRIPNLFRDFCAEGASNAAIVPVLSEYAAQKSKEEFWELANVILNILLIVLTVITLLGILCAPLIVRLIAPGFADDPVKLATTIKLTRIIFPYLLLIGLAAYAMGILNSLRHFVVPAFAPCLLNISIIVCALMFGEGITGLASGVLIGGFLQLLVQIPVLYKKGFRLNLFSNFKHPAARTIGRLLAPRMLSSGIYQLNNFVDSIFGSFALIVGEGGVAILYFAYRLIQFPLGIFSTSLSQAILPALSTQALEQDQHDLRNTLSFGLRSTWFVMLPASVGFMVLAKPIIQALFGGGRFDSYSVNATANVLICYSIGLCAYASTKIVQSCFFALKDTITPTKISALALGLNILFNTLLMFPYKICGLALATSLSGIISFLVLFSLLLKRLKSLDAALLIKSFLKILCASACMGIIAYFVLKVPFLTGQGAMIKALHLVVMIITAVAAYFGCSFIFGVREARELWGWLRGKKI